MVPLHDCKCCATTSNTHYTISSSTCQIDPSKISYSQDRSKNLVSNEKQLKRTAMNEQIKSLCLTAENCNTLDEVKLLLAKSSAFWKSAKEKDQELGDFNNKINFQFCSYCFLSITYLLSMNTNWSMHKIVLIAKESVNMFCLFFGAYG